MAIGYQYAEITFCDDISPFLSDFENNDTVEFSDFFLRRIPLGRARLHKVNFWSPKFFRGLLVPIGGPLPSGLPKKAHLRPHR